jgi:hypothetical protein
VISAADLDAALDEINRLRSAIRAHRDDICNTEDSIRVADIELWLTLKEK